MADGWSRMFTTRFRLALFVRRAEHSDYQAVVDIDKEYEIYRGYDYVPEYYHEILQKPNTYCFVGIFHKKIVAFTALHVIEDGSVLLSCSERMISSLQSLGLYRDFSRLTQEIILHQFPSLRRRVWSAILWDNTIKQAEKPDPPFTILQKWNGCMFNQLTCDRIQMIIRHIEADLGAQKSTLHAKLLIGQEIEGLLNTPDLIQKLFPEGILFIGPNARPIRLTVPNSRLIKQMGNFYQITNQHANIRAIGVHVNHLAPNHQIACHIHYHGADVNCLMVLILEALKNALRDASPRKHTVGIGLYYPLHIQPEGMLSRLEDAVKPTLVTQMGYLQASQFPE